MPIPIRPAGDSSNFSYNGTDKESTDNSFFMMNLDSLAGALATGNMGRLGSIQINAEATDGDATLLLDLFNRCTIVSEAESVEDKKYAIPSDFSSNNLLRLKAASLVNGDTTIIKFTSKAARVIKTLVLSEQNAYTKSAIVKPYSVILAENKMNSAGHSTLAFSKTASNISAFAQSNQAIPPEYFPHRDDAQIMGSYKLVKVYGSSTNKQYIIALFRVRDRYTVIAWNGRNIAGNSLAIQPKGTFQRYGNASSVFETLRLSKTRDGYTEERLSAEELREIIVPMLPRGTNNVTPLSQEDEIEFEFDETSDPRIERMEQHRRDRQNSMSRQPARSMTPQPDLSALSDSSALSEEDEDASSEQSGNPNVSAPSQAFSEPSHDDRNGRPITPEYMPTKSNIQEIWKSSVYIYTKNGLNDKCILAILTTKTNPDKFCLIEASGINIPNQKLSIMPISMYNSGMSAIHELNRLGKNKENVGYQESSSSAKTDRDILSALPDSLDQPVLKKETEIPNQQSEKSDEDFLFDESDMFEFKL
jgi:predicted DNA-binding WGR domain protein